MYFIIEALKGRKILPSPLLKFTFSDPLMVPPSAGAEAKSAKKLSSFDDGTTEAGGAWKGCDVSVVPEGPENKSTKSARLEDTVD